MTGWDQVLASAISGTARQPLQSRDRIATRTPEETLLASAALIGVRRLAASKPVTYAGLILEPGTVDARPLVSGGAAARLREMLGGTRSQLVPEWLRLARQHGRRPRPEILPALLDAHKGASEVEDVTEVAGARGRWLGRLNPDWAYLGDDDPQVTFQTGTGKTRFIALRRLRRQDPAGARQLLEQSWEAETGADRALGVAALHTGLAADDEAFLNRAMQDRRREVRHAAVVTLARLPGSALAARLRDRVARLITFRKGLLGGKLDVTLPAACDAGMVADGVEAKGAPQGMGERAWWLRQMLLLVPPSTWPVDAIGPGASGEWAELLLGGWSQAARWFNDARWAEALIELMIQKDKDHKIRGFLGRDLAGALPAEQAERVMMRALSAAPMTAATLIGGMDFPWSVPFSQAFVRALPELIKLRWVAFGDALAKADERCHPTVHPEVEGLADQARKQPGTAKFLDELAATLRYRADMWKELQA